ncbi:MAG: aminotransferase class V-fold PLP-dependent enzyme, partial [Candidatus Velthaea sp.]
KGHAAGAVVLIDGAQAVPHTSVDVQDLGCDFLVFSGHKMCAPPGSGAVWGRRALLEGMRPFMYGGDMISRVTTDLTTWNELPWKFEAGTSAYVDAIGLGAAVDYLEAVGGAIVSRVLALPAAAHARVAVRKPHVALGGPLAYAEVVVEQGR